MQHLRIDSNKPGHFACVVLTPQATKGDARPLWKLHLIVPAASCGEYYIKAYHRAALVVNISGTSNEVAEPG